MAWFDMFPRYTGTTASIILGATKSLTDNYWLFTLPLIGHDEHDAQNGAYIFVSALQNAILWGIVGLSLDIARMMHKKTENTEPASSMDVFEPHYRSLDFSPV